MNENNTIQRLATEALGTALLIIVGCGSIVALAIVRAGDAFGSADLVTVALAFGGIVVIAVYVFGYISGAHINPAVTVALAAAGKFRWREVPGYIVAQLIGATVGAAIIVGALGSEANEAGLGISTYSSDVPWLQAFVAEFVGTLLLILHLGAIHRGAAPAVWFVIGTAVFAAVIVIGPVTGASINPARSVGPMLVQQIAGGTVRWEQLPVYLASQLLAGVAAALLFRVISHTKADSPIEVAGAKA